MSITKKVLHLVGTVALAVAVALLLRATLGITVSFGRDVDEARRVVVYTACGQVAAVDVTTEGGRLYRSPEASRAPGCAEPLDVLAVSVRLVP